MNHNYHMTRFAAQEHRNKLQNEAQIHRTLQAASSQTSSARFSVQLNHLYHWMASWKPANYLATWDPGQAFRNLIYKHS